MKITHLILTLLAGGSLMSASLTAQAHEYYTRSFVIIHPWALPTDAGSTAAAVYLKIEEISAGDKLIGAHSSLAQSVELVRAPPKGSAAEAAKLTEITIAAGTSVALSEEGAYLKMTQLTAPLLWGRSYPMTLDFEKSGPIPVMISIGAH